MEFYFQYLFKKSTQKRLTSTCLIFYILLTTRSHGKVVRPPTNSATSVGGSSWFNCSSNGVGIQWIYSEDGSTTSQSATLLTDTNCNVINNDKANFETEKPSASECNLIIPKVSLQLGGYYTCHTDGGAGANASAHAMLVVVETNTNIKSNRTEEILEGEVISFGVTVTYNGPVPISTATIPPLYPSLNWTLESDSEDITSSSTEITTTTSSSHIIVTATVPTVPSYVCTLFFNPPSGPPPSCDRGAPSFTFNWTSLQINTSYNGTSSITETPYNESGICKAIILHCSYNGYPAPHDIHWIDVRRNEIMPTNKTHLTAEYAGEYVCSVTNVIKGANYTSHTWFTLDHNGSSTATPCKGVSEINATVSQYNGSGITYEILSRNKISLVSSTFNSGNSENSTDVKLMCITDGIPNATITWTNPCGNSIIPNDTQHIVATMSGNYTCSAYNTINDRNFTANSAIRIIEGLPDASQVCKSLTSESPSKTTNEDGIIILISVLVIYFGLNSALLFIFLLIYHCYRKCREAINRIFQWIERALPCMNNKGCSCSWEMVLFILCSILVGLIFIPYVLIASKCKKDPKKSQGDSPGIDLPARNPSTNENSHENGGQHPRTSYSTGGQIPQYPPPPAPKRSPSRGAGYPNSHQDFPHSTPNYRPPGPSTTVSPEGILYQELRIDSNPGSRKPVDLINAGNGGVYADLHST